MARSHYEEALNQFRGLGDRAGTARVLADLGNLARDDDDYDAAEDFYQEALRELSQLGRRTNIARVLADMAQCAVRQHRPERALTLAGAAAEIRRTVESGSEGTEESTRRVFEQTKADMAAHAHREAWAAGQAMTIDQVIQYGLGQSD
jgi:tetratricopeptide (TPR) repeat protein